MAAFSWRRFWLSSSIVGWVIVFLLLAIVQTVGGRLFTIGQDVVREFEQAAGRSIWSIGLETWSGTQQISQEPYRILLLGTDEVAGSNRPTVLTDTMIVASYRPEDNVVRMLAVPRDLYIPQYDSKINTLYRQDPALPEQAVEQLLGVPIDTTVVIRLQDVAELVDLVGGISVEVPHTFEDDRYPRDGVDVTVERDPAKLYEVVKFEAGPQVFDGATAIKYARTRKSLDPTEGSDQARIRRQQQVISALVARLTHEEVLANPTTLGKLYRWYSSRFAANVPLPVLGKALRWLQQSSGTPEIRTLDLKATDLPTAPNVETLLIHPSLARYGGQWVYELADRSGEQLKQFVQANGL